MNDRKPTPERLGAFSDGVFAVIITIMVQVLKPPPQPGSGANFRKGRRANPGALGKRESLACQIAPKFKLCTSTLWGSN